METRDELRAALIAFFERGGVVRKMPNGYAETETNYVNGVVSLDPQKDDGCRWNGVAFGTSDG